MSFVPSFSPHVKFSIVQSILTGVPVMVRRRTPLFFIFSILFTLSFGPGKDEYSQKLYFCAGKNEEKEMFFSFLFPSRFIRLMNG